MYPLDSHSKVYLQHNRISMSGLFGYLLPHYINDFHKKAKYIVFFSILFQQEIKLNFVVVCCFETCSTPRLAKLYHPLSVNLLEILFFICCTKNTC